MVFYQIGIWFSAISFLLLLIPLVIKNHSFYWFAYYTGGFLAVIATVMFILLSKAFGINPGNLKQYVIIGYIFNAMVIYVHIKCAMMRAR